MSINNVMNMDINNDMDKYIRGVYLDLGGIKPPKTPKDQVLDLLQENPELVDEVMVILRNKKIQKIKNKW